MDLDLDVDSGHAARREPSQACRLAACRLFLAACSRHRLCRNATRFGPPLRRAALSNRVLSKVCQVQERPGPSRSPGPSPRGGCGLSQRLTGEAFAGRPAANPPASAGLVKKRKPPMGTDAPPNTTHSSVFLHSFSRIIAFPDEGSPRRDWIRAKQLSAGMAPGCAGGIQAT